MIIDNRLAVCWFLNSDLENDELRNQLRSMSGAGIGSVFFHWMIGGPAYMSERWLDALETTIEECSKLDMRTWLYDEAWCPSCYAGGIILAERPDLQAKTIWSEKFDAKGGERVRRRFDLMNIISIAALPIVDGSPVLKDAVDLGGQVGPVAPEIDIPYRHNYGYYPFSTPRQHWRAAKKGKMLWELDWDAPAGTDWRVYIFCQRESLRWDGVDRIDVLNPESIQMFLDVTHEKYAERFSKYFGNVIPGVMTDEFKYLPAPWSESLPELYREKYGSYLVEILPALVDKAIPESVVVKSNYHRLVSNVFAENYAAPMSRWCADRGLVLTGHISPEEDGSVEVLCAGNVATHIRHFQMPGSDIIIQAVGDRAHAELNLSPRLAASVARQEGARRVFIEAGACCEDDLSLEFFKHLFDWLMVHGINFINIHAFSYSLGGHKKFLAGQTIDTYGNLLPHFKALSDYIEEKCALFTKYRPVVKTALLKPMTAFRTTNELGGKSERGRMVDRFFTNLCLALIEEHVEFDLLDEDGADSWSVEESTLAVGEARYETVLIPRDAVVAEEAIVKLAEFAEAGGVTATSNPKLEMLTKDGAVEVLSAALKKVDSDIEAAKLAAERENAWGILSKPDAKSVHMMKAENSDKDRVCFLVNISSEKPAEIAFESEGGKVPLTLKPCESRLIELPLNPELFSVDNAEAQPLAIREWKVVPIKSNHFPLSAGMTIEITEEGVPVENLVCEPEELHSLRNSLKIDGMEPNWDAARKTSFHTDRTFEIPVASLFTKGTHQIEFDDSTMPTLLLSGDFSVFVPSKEKFILKKSIETNGKVDRVACGFPFLRGELVFESEFSLKQEYPTAELIFPNRKGSIAVEIDGEKKGIAAWSPNRLAIGNLRAGVHFLKLKVIGDGIGLYRTGFNNAGCSEVEIISAKPF